MTDTAKRKLYAPNQLVFIVQSICIFVVVYTPSPARDVAFGVSLGFPLGALTQMLWQRIFPRLSGPEENVR